MKKSKNDLFPPRSNYVFVSFILFFLSLSLAFNNVSVISIHLSPLSYVSRHEVHLFAFGGMLGWRGLDNSEESREV